MIIHTLQGIHTMTQTDDGDEMYQRHFVSDGERRSPVSLETAV